MPGRILARNLKQYSRSRLIFARSLVWSCMKEIIFWVDVVCIICVKLIWTSWADFRSSFAISSDSGRFVRLFFFNIFYRTSKIPFWIAMVHNSTNLCRDIILHFNLGNIITCIIERIHRKDWKTIIFNLSHSICNKCCQISRILLDPKMFINESVWQNMLSFGISKSFDRATTFRISSKMLQSSRRGTDKDEFGPITLEQAKNRIFLKAPFPQQS